MEVAFVGPSDCMWEWLIRNIYSGTVVGSIGFDSGVCVAEIMGCSVTDRQYEEYSYVRKCEL